MNHKEAVQHIKTTLMAFGPSEAITLTQKTWAKLHEAMCVLADQPAPVQPQLTVRLRSYPESNGKRNWTADFVRTEPFEGLVGTAGGITIGHGEYWNRVAYYAERARFLIGERTTEPSIREYGADVETPEEWLGTDSESKLLNEGW